MSVRNRIGQLLKGTLLSQDISKNAITWYVTDHTLFCFRRRKSPEIKYVRQ